MHWYSFPWFLKVLQAARTALAAYDAAPCGYCHWCEHEQEESVITTDPFGKPDLATAIEGLREVLK